MSKFLFSFSIVLLLDITLINAQSTRQVSNCNRLYEPSNLSLCRLTWTAATKNGTFFEFPAESVFKPKKTGNSTVSTTTSSLFAYDPATESSGLISNEFICKDDLWGKSDCNRSQKVIENFTKSDGKPSNVTDLSQLKNLFILTNSQHCKLSFPPAKSFLEDWRLGYLFPCENKKGFIFPDKSLVVLDATEEMKVPLKFTIERTPYSETRKKPQEVVVEVLMKNNTLPKAIPFPKLLRLNSSTQVNVSLDQQIPPDINVIGGMEEVLKKPPFSYLSQSFANASQMVADIFKPFDQSGGYIHDVTYKSKIETIHKDITSCRQLKVTVTQKTEENHITFSSEVQVQGKPHWESQDTVDAFTLIHGKELTQQLQIHITHHSVFLNLTGRMVIISESMHVSTTEEKLTGSFCSSGNRLLTQLAFVSVICLCSFLLSNWLYF